MSMAEFESLSLEDRAGIVLDGTCLLTMKFDDYLLKLFILENNHFAEVWFCSDRNEIVEINLAGKKALTKWLERIDLTMG